MIYYLYMSVNKKNRRNFYVIYQCIYGSFARTYKGHGTDRALLGGIMGFSTDDRRIPDSFSIADERGLQYSFTANTTETEIHPNTVDIHMTDENGQKLIVRGESVG